MPSAIIVFNTTELEVDQSEWDVGNATKKLMEIIKDDIRNVPAFKQAARFWKEQKGIDIKDTEDLLNKYYASITVVRIPRKGRYSLLQKQIFKLRRHIRDRCNDSFFAKQRANMTSNADELGTYLQAGFDHFSTKLDKPFNFLDVNARSHPIPRDLSDHIKNVAGAAYEGGIEKEGPRLFQALSPFLASCILLERTRLGRHGARV